MDFSERIHKAQHGDARQLNWLLAEWRPWLREQARGLVRKDATARFDTSDIVQHSLLEAFRSLGHFRGNSPGEFSNWLRRIMKRQAAGQHRFHGAGRRRTFRECRSSCMVGDERPSPDRQLVQGERLRTLQQALAQLPLPLREVVIGRVFEEQSFNELSARLGRTARVIRRQWAEAVRELAESLRGFTTSQDGA